MTMALILSVPRRLAEGEKLMRSGKWAGWAPSTMLGHRVGSKLLGIVGMGRIGLAVARARARLRPVDPLSQPAAPARSDRGRTGRELSRQHRHAAADQRHRHYPLPAHQRNARTGEREAHRRDEADRLPDQHRTRRDRRRESAGRRAPDGAHRGRGARRLHPRTRSRPGAARARQCRAAAPSRIGDDRGSRSLRRKGHCEYPRVVRRPPPPDQVLEGWA